MSQYKMDINNVQKPNLKTINNIGKYATPGSNIKH